MPDDLETSVTIVARSKITAANAKVVLNQLRAYESRNVTFIDPQGGWPIVWERAQGTHVWDIDGKRYLDLTAAFGVAAAGHANKRVVRAGQEQMARLLHAMGDVHPHALKAELARQLSRITFERWDRLFGPRARTAARTGKTIFCNSGFEAVEVALKTALLATGKRGVIAFEGGYHGLGYGALNATHRRHFRGAFLKQLGQFGYFVPFPSAAGSKSGTQAGASGAFTGLRNQIEGLLKKHSIGAILVEPVQVRGGINVPPLKFLNLLRSVCDQHGVLLILDEIYTGFGRTGKWFACEHSAVAPDLICLGKAMTGGFPLSACVGRADLMDQAWPPSAGEAIHTSTYLGHPVGCAMALAQIEELNRGQLVRRSAELGGHLLAALSALAGARSPWQLAARGLGLLAGLEVRTPGGTPGTNETLSMIKTLLQRGFIFLPEGAAANVISFTPPLTISKPQLDSAVGALREVLHA